MTDLSTVGKRLKYARSQKRLFQKDVAERLGVTDVDVSRWESDKHLPGGDRLIELANLYGVPATWLVRGTGPAPVITDDVSRGTSQSAGNATPETAGQAIRRVRAIAARLEGDLHEWGAEASAFDAMRAALATEFTIDMLESADRPGDMAAIFGNYERFADALRLALKDRIEFAARTAPRLAKPIDPAIVQPAPRREGKTGRAKAGG